MFDSNLNINPINTNFPEPDIDVDSAWISMQKMLDEADKQTILIPKNTFTYFNNFWRLGIILLISVSFIWWFAEHKKNKNSSIEKVLTTNIIGKKQQRDNSINTNQSFKTNTGSIVDYDSMTFLKTEINKKTTATTNDTINFVLNKSDSINKNEAVKIITSKEINNNLKDSLHKKYNIKINFSNNKIAGNNTKRLLKKYSKNAIVKNDIFIRFRKPGKIKTPKKINNNNSENDSNNGFNKTITKNKIGEIIKNNSYKSKVDDKEDNIIKNRNTIIGKAKKYHKNLASSIKIKITPAIPITFIVDSASIDTTNKNIKQNVKLKKVDSKGLKKISEILSKNKVSVGLQGNFPIQNSGNYFTGINAQNQPYLLLIPSFWATKKINKNEIMISFTPLQQNFTKNKIMDTVTAPVPVPGPGPGPVFSSPYINTQRLLKTFGFSAGLSYNYYVTSSFSIGLGLKYNRQNLSLQRDVTFSLITRTEISDTMFILRRSSPDWNYLKPYFISGQLELAYTKKKFSSGFSISAPITNLSLIDKENLRPINSQLFIRWKIF